MCIIFARSGIFWGNYSLKMFCANLFWFFKGEKNHTDDTEGSETEKRSIKYETLGSKVAKEIICLCHIHGSYNSWLSHRQNVRFFSQCVMCADMLTSSFRPIQLVSVTAYWICAQAKERCCTTISLLWPTSPASIAAPASPAKACGTSIVLIWACVGQR